MSARSSFSVPSAPKCFACATSVYANEQISYDGVVYHTNCLKCLNCHSTVSLAAIAKIKGDIYCKNCFKRIFLSEGRYSSFGDKTLSHHDKEKHGTTGTHGDHLTTHEEEHPKDTAANASSTATSSSSTSTNASDSSNGHSTPSTTSTTTDTISIPLTSTGRRASLAPCFVHDCKSSRDGATPSCKFHAPLWDEESQNDINSLFEMINARDADKVKHFFEDKNINLALKYNIKGITALEQAFGGVRNSKQCGMVMVDLLREKLNK